MALDLQKIPAIVRGILEARGISAADLDSFFNPRCSDLLPPEALPGIVDAAEEILSAVKAREKIVVFGDYDCDGVSATAILTKAIAAISGDVTPFVPRRLDEGYGMTDASVKRLLEENPDVQLIVTVDNGINSNDQVAELMSRGISVVVTDHHLPSETLPPAAAVVNPKVAAPTALEGLCGAGVAFLLARQLFRGAFPDPKDSPGVSPLLVLAGLATVTDIMPLVGQNRILVSAALEKFHSFAPVGLRELYGRAARNAADRLVAKDFGFLIGPRINASGRLANGMEALDLILAADREEAREYARIVDGRNVERKTIEQRMTEEALAQVVPEAPAQVIDLPDGHPGVAGIVAARILERLEHPAPVFVLAGGHGSARAPVGINVRDAMEACKETLTRYGGHAAAGGFSVKEGCLATFREQVCAYCAAQGEAVQAAAKEAAEDDAWVETSDVTLELAEWMTRMEPFGEGNKEPVFGIRNVYLSDVRPLGAEGRHLAVALKGSGLKAIWWNRGDLVEELRHDAFRPRDIRFTVEISDYGGRHVELRLVAL